VTVTAREAARTLVERELRAREGRLGREEATRGAVTAVVREFLRPGERAWLIGSLAWGGFGVRSDVDVVVSGLTPERGLELEVLVGSAANAPVDLLVLEHLPPPFRARVEQEGFALG
jgi:predicted nucleotidyltransferase